MKRRCRARALRDAFVPHLVRVRLDDGSGCASRPVSELPSELASDPCLVEARLCHARRGETMGSQGWRRSRWSKSRMTSVQLGRPSVNG